MVDRVLSECTLHRGRGMQTVDHPPRQIWHPQKAYHLTLALRSTDLLAMGLLWVGTLIKTIRALARFLTIVRIGILFSLIVGHWYASGTLGKSGLIRRHSTDTEQQLPTEKGARRWKLL